MVVSPDVMRSAAYTGLAGLGVFTSAVLLGWVPGSHPPAKMLCPEFFGTAQLFGVLLMLSPCTVRIGSAWLNVSLVAAVLLA